MSPQLFRDVSELSPGNCAKLDNLHKPDLPMYFARKMTHKNKEKKFSKQLASEVTIAIAHKFSVFKVKVAAKVGRQKSLGKSCPAIHKFTKVFKVRGCAPC